MFHLYGFYTQNSLKVLYVLEELGADFEYEFVNLGAAEHKADAFRKMTPVGKVPVLEHDGEYLFESGAICRYVANVMDSPLYPSNKMARAKVDQWMDFFTCHLGHWMTKIYYELVIKQKFDLGEADEAGVAEAHKFAAVQLKMLDGQLSDSDWLANNALSIADLFAYAYVEQHRAFDLSLHDYPNVAQWLARIDSLDSITNARSRLPS